MLASPSIFHVPKKHVTFAVRFGAEMRIEAWGAVLDAGFFAAWARCDDADFGGG